VPCLETVGAPLSLGVGLGPEVTVVTCACLTLDVPGPLAVWLSCSEIDGVPRNQEVDLVSEVTVVT
jgi:hypothetical protein